MSRYKDWDNDDDYAVLDYGRWQRNARAVLKSKRGRKALAELREALMALPERRLIANAFCTVGGIGARLPEFTEAEAAAYDGSSNWRGHDDWLRRMHDVRREERADLARVLEQGEGVCVNAAYAWYRKVKDGMDPAEAFASLPTIYDGDPDYSGNEIEETARQGEAAGLTFTLAWELAYRNDETLSDKTPEERHTAFIAWIDEQLADGTVAS